MNKQHYYKSTIVWTGNNGEGTINYNSYSRSQNIIIENKLNILGSYDPAFRGDINKHNPEELLLASIASCHMLWYLHLCAEAGVIVLEYTDNATGIMVETPGTGEKFTEATLSPVVYVKEESMIKKANDLHMKANECCFISNSVNFPVKHNPTSKVY